MSRRRRFDRLECQGCIYKASTYCWRQCRTTFGREKNTEAHGKRLQRLHTLLYGFVLSGKSGARAKVQKRFNATKRINQN